MKISKEEAESFKVFLKEKGLDPKENLGNLIFSDGFAVLNEDIYQEYLREIHNEGDDLYFEAIPVDIRRVQLTDIKIDFERFRNFYVAKYSERFHLYGIDDDDSSVHLTTLNNFQMVKLMNSEQFLEEFYKVFYESLQKP